MKRGAAAIILAGGTGSRTQADINKVYLPIDDRPMVEYSLETMDRSPLIDDLVLVIRSEDAERAEHIVSEMSLSTRIQMVPGGGSRQASELAGLRALASDIDSGDTEIVAIHDGARPFLTQALLATVIETAGRRGGAIPGLRMLEPLYRIDGPRPESLPTEDLQRVQTPQAFTASVLLDTYEQAAAADFEAVDTAEAIARFSDLQIEIVPGDDRNIKVTYIEDFFRAGDFSAVFDQGRWTDRP